MKDNFACAGEDVVSERRTCEHGAVLGSVPNWPGGWNGGVSRCACCFGTFGYIDSGSMGGSGGKSNTWLPKDRCGLCGGKYVAHAWGDQK